MILTKDQIETVRQGEPVRLSAHELGAEVVLLRSDVYDRIAELLDDWDPHLMRHQMARMMHEDWTDSEMSVYDQ